MFAALQNLLPPITERMSSKNSTFYSLFNNFQLSAEENASADQLLQESKEKVLVGGGSGFVGKDLCLQLRNRGYHVIVISRTEGADKMTWEQIKKQGIPERTKAVVNLAGQNVLDPLWRWSSKFKDLCRSSRIETTKLLATAVADCPENSRPKVFISVSGVGYYDPDGRTIYDEYGKKGSDWLADLASDWEAPTLLCKTRRVIFRPGVVLGRNGGMIQQIFLPFYFGLGGRMGSGDQPLAWIHVKDLTGMICKAVEDDSMTGVYNAVAPELISNREFVSAFAEALNRPALFPLPDFVWNLVFGQERAVMITKGQKVVPSRTLKTGYIYRYPSIREACREFAAFSYTDPDVKKVQ